jgi:hypothetical protein
MPHAGDLVHSAVELLLPTWVLGLGALLPLGFTDGSTLLTWWGK